MWLCSARRQHAYRGGTCVWLSRRNNSTRGRSSFAHEERPQERQPDGEHTELLLQRKAGMTLARMSRGRLAVGAVVAVAIALSVVATVQSRSEGGFHPFISARDAERIAAIALAHHLRSTPGRALIQRAQEVVVTVLGREPSFEIRQIVQEAGIRFVDTPSRKDRVTLCWAATLNSIMPGRATIHIGCWADELVAHELMYEVRRIADTWSVVSEQWLKVS